MTKAKRIKQLQEWYSEDVTETNKWSRRARESYRFYTGKGQWTEEDEGKLESENRPHLTINLTKAHVDVLVGQQIDNRQDPKLYPRRGGTVPIAALGTEVLKHVMDGSDIDGHDESTEVFTDGVIGGVGVFGVEHRYTKDRINGELVVLKKSPFMVTFDQNATEYNFQLSGRRVFEDVWMTEEEINLSFGVSTKDLDEGTEDPRYSDDRLEYTEDAYTGEDQTTDRKGMFLVKRCYWRVWEKQTFLVDLRTWTSKLLPQHAVRFATQQIQSMTQQEFQSNLTLIKRAGWMLYETWFAGDIELQHTKNPFDGLMDMPYFPFYPYWADGYAMGPIDNLKDPQRELNKRVSQELHILNTTANSGWMVKDGSNQEYIDEIKQIGAQSGFILDLSKVGGVAEKIESNQMPQGHYMMAVQHEKYMNQIGVDPNLRGISEEDQSGKALQERKASALGTVSIIYHNFNRTQKALYRFLWNAVTRKDHNGQSVIYSDQEIMLLIQEKTLKAFIREDGSIDLSQWHADELGTYGMKMGHSPSSETKREEDRDILLKIAAVYPPGPDGRAVIPPQMILRQTDLPDAEEAIQRLDQMEEAAAQAAKEAAQLEKAKVMTSLMPKQQPARKAG